MQFVRSPMFFDLFTGWGTVHASIRRDGAISPSNGLKSYSIIEDAVAGQSHLVFRESNPILANTSYRMGWSGRVRATSTHTRLMKTELYAGTTPTEYADNFFLFADPSNATEFSHGNGAGPEMFLDDFSVTDLGGGWTNVEAIFHTATATYLQFSFGMTDAGGSGEYDGDGVSGLDVDLPYYERV